MTLVWIDTEEAIIVRWDDRATVERLHSDVEGRHRSSGHERGGPNAEALEHARREHLRQFLDDVAAHVPGSGDVTVVGPGLVRERLERTLRADDRRLRRQRHVRSSPADRLSEQELVAHVRALAGDVPRRRHVPA
ncbi:MAG TPA: hypothetical protein VGK16_16255 [Candidatus Limnocylindrales bacterium]